MSSTTSNAKPALKGAVRNQVTAPKSTFLKDAFALVVVSVVFFVALKFSIVALDKQVASEQAGVSRYAQQAK